MSLKRRHDEEFETIYDTHKRIDTTTMKIRRAITTILPRICEREAKQAIDERNGIITPRQAGIELNMLLYNVLAWEDHRWQQLKPFRIQDEDEYLAVEKVRAKKRFYLNKTLHEPIVCVYNLVYAGWLDSDLIGNVIVYLI
jgi:hypothetical protein